MTKEEVFPQLTPEEKKALEELTKEVNGSFQLVKVGRQVEIEGTDSPLLLVKYRGEGRQILGGFRWGKKELFGRWPLISREQVPFGKNSFPLEIWVTGNVMPYPNKGEVYLMPGTLEDREPQLVRYLEPASLFDSVENVATGEISEVVGLRIEGRLVVQIGPEWQKRDYQEVDFSARPPL